MSGNGRGSSGGGVVDTVPDSGECKKFYKQVNLMSTQEEVLEKLKAGSELELSVVKTGGKSSLHALYRGDYVGSVVTNAAQIIRCMEEEGHKYTAIVTFIDGGVCTVEVRMLP